MAVGNRGMRRRVLILLAAGALYWCYTNGKLDKLFNAHSCPPTSYFDVPHSQCYPCSSCEAGTQLVAPCHGTSDAVCKTCAPNVEYLKDGACAPCRACGMGMQTLQPCQGTADTVCSGEQAAATRRPDVSGFHDTAEAQGDSELHGRLIKPPAGAHGSPLPRKGEAIAADAAQRFGTGSQPPPPPPPPPPPAPPPPPPPPPPPSGSTGSTGSTVSSSEDTSWKPRIGRSSTGPLVPYTKDWIEEGWGAECFSPSNMDVLVALPYSPRMGDELIRLMFTNLKAMECANHGFNLHLALYDRPFNNSMNAKATKLSGRTVLATIRNIVVHEYLRPEHEYVLWMDADVVKYPSDLIQRMYESNPHGVTAPLVVIESSDEDWYHHQLCGKAVCPHGTICGRPQCPRAKMFYDRAAFITAGSNITDHEAFPGNALPWPPYLGRGAWRTRVQDCESVGTVYMLPAKIYRQQPGKPAPPIHFPTAFTEHYPVVHFAKYVLDMPVRTDMAIEAEHAYLPKYGQEWHSEPMEIWAQWLAPYRGQSLTDPALIETLKPDFYISEEPRLREKGMCEC